MRLSVAAALLVSCPVIASGRELRLLPLQDATFVETSYAWIEGIEVGPWIAHEGSDVTRGERWRLVILRSSDATRLIVVERIVRGVEGSQRVAGRWRLDIPNGQHFEFVAWTGIRSFIFELDGQQFTLSELRAEKPTVTVHER